jgi:hypothetical protein
MYNNNNNNNNNNLWLFLPNWFALIPRQLTMLPGVQKGIARIKMRMIMEQWWRRYCQGNVEVPEDMPLSRLVFPT